MQLMRRSSPHKVRKTFVYLAFAPSAGGSYVKVGMSVEPIRRAQELRAPNGEKVVSLYESSMPAPDVALAFEVEHEILWDIASDGMHGEWRFLPSSRPWLFDWIIESADRFVQQSIHADAEMRRVQI